MKRTPIFIHSMFRTGSTYIWNKFRENKNCWCYYEPFHQEFLNITADKPLWNIDRESTQNFKHPDITRDYLFEYKDSIKSSKKGLSLFKKQFSFDDFYLPENAKMPDLKRYLNRLIKGAGNKIPVMQFNRSTFRMGWFRQNFNNSFNIYLVRDPRNQFQSYMEIYSRLQLNSFLTMNLLTAGLNRESPPFQKLATLVPLLEFHGESFERESYIYSQLLPVYGLKEQYYIFYFIWYQSLLESLFHTDLIIYIDLLGSDPDYQNIIIKHLKSNGITGFNFKDCQITTYQDLKIPPQDMDTVEQEVQQLVINQYISKKEVLTNLADSRIPHLPIIPKNFKQGKGTIKPYKHLKQNIERKMNQALHHLANLLYDKNAELKIIQTKVQEQESRMAKLQTLLEEAKTALNGANRNLEDSKKQLVENSNKLVQVQNIKVQLIEKVTDLSKTISDRDKEIQKLEKRMDTLRQQCQQLKQVEIKNEKEIQQLQKQVDSLQHQVQQLEEKNDSLEQSKKRLQQNIMKLEQTGNEMEEKILRLNQQIDEQNSSLHQQQLKVEQQADIILRYSHNNQSLNQWIIQLKRRIENKETELVRLLNSWSYRLGHGLLSPLRGLIHIYKKIFRKK